MINKDHHNAYQIKYYGSHFKPNMQSVGETPYIRQHIDNTIQLADLNPSQEILEVGAGLEIGRAHV